MENFPSPFLSLSSFEPHCHPPDLAYDEMVLWSRRVKAIVEVPGSNPGDDKFFLHVVFHLRVIELFKLRNANSVMQIFV